MCAVYFCPGCPVFLCFLFVFEIIEATSKANDVWNGKFLPWKTFRCCLEVPGRVSFSFTLPAVDLWFTRCLSKGYRTSSQESSTRIIWKSCHAHKRPCACPLINSIFRTGKQKEELTNKKKVEVYRWNQEQNWMDSFTQLRSKMS